MSGRKIHDFGGYPHTSDMAMKSKTHLKEFHSAEGAGHVDGKYPDTTEMIHRDQMKGDSQTKKHEIKPGYRN
jgi:hypothetical protein